MDLAYETRIPWSGIQQPDCDWLYLEYSHWVCTVLSENLQIANLRKEKIKLLEIAWNI